MLALQVYANSKGLDMSLDMHRGGERVQPCTGSRAQVGRLCGSHARSVSSRPQRALHRLATCSCQS